MPIGMQVIIRCNSKYLQITVETHNVVATLEALKDIHTEQSEYLHNSPAITLFHTQRIRCSTMC